MSSASPPSTARDRLLQSLIVRGIEAWERGEAPDFEPELNGDPELAAELEQFFNDWRELQRCVRNTAPGDSPALAADRPPARIGPFELLERVAFGGMGVVYKARHVTLDRIVAIKLLLRGVCSSPEDVRRFQREAAATAQLDHPHIVPIYEVGQHGDWPYLVMPLIAGGSLADRLAQGPLPPREAARLVRDVARALDYAHGQGIVHRDVKPANILLDEGAAGEPSPRACISDFGLAKRLRIDESMTRTGQMLGTPSYMAPEQTSGTRFEVGPTTDVYALGAVLYAALSGRPPFQSAEPLETLRQVRETEPVPLRQLDPATPRDLETLSLACLAKRPDHRPATAGAVADELDRFLAGKPLVTRPTSLLERSIRWVQREPTIAWLSLAVLSTVVVGSVVSLFFGWQARQLANAERAQRSAIERAFYRSLITQADLEWRSNNLTRAEQLLDSCPVTLRGWEWHYLKKRNHPELRELHATGPAMKQVAYDPRGDYVAAAGDEGTLCIWRVSTGEMQVESPCGAPVSTLAWSPRGDTLALGLNDGRVLLWDVEKQTPRWERRDHQERVRDVKFHPDSNQIASGDDLGVVLLQGVQEGHVIRRWETTLESAVCVAFDSTGERLAAAGDGERIYVWDTATGEHRQSLTTSSSVTHCLAFAPADSGEVLMSDDASYDVLAWDLNDGQPQLRCSAHKSPILSLTIDRRNGLGISGDKDGRIHVWELATGRVQETHLGHHLFVFDLAICPTREEFASCGVDGRVRLWRIGAAAVPARLRGHTDRVNEVAWSPDGRLVASAAQDGTVRWWDAATGEASSANDSSRLEGVGILGLAFAPRERWIVGAGNDGRLRRWELATGRLEHEVTADSGALWSVAVSPDGRRVAWASERGELGLTNANELRAIRSWSGHDDTARCVRFRNDGRELASCGDDGYVRFWNPETGRALREFSLGIGPLWNLAFFADRQRLAVCATSGQIVVLDVQTGERLLTCSGHMGTIYAVSVSPDGERLVSAGFDQTVKVWDTRTGLDLLTLREPIWSVNSVAFSPDGRTIAAGSSDWSVHWWRVAP